MADAGATRRARARVATLVVLGLGLGAGPVRADGLVDRGVRARSAGDLRTAQALLRAAVAAEPAALTPQLELAVTLAWSGDLAAAAAAYAAALTLDPSSRAARAGAARIAAWRGDTDVGLRGFTALHREAPGETEPMLGLAAIYRQRDQPSLARRWYRATLAVAPDDAEAGAGLRALARDRRIEVAAGVGVRTSAGGTAITTYQARAKVRLERHRWLALTATTAPEAAPAPPRPDGGRLRLEAGRGGPRWLRALGYELGREAAGTTHAIDGALSRRWPVITVGATARLRREADGALTSLASLGAERALGAAAVGLRGFVGVGSGDVGAATAVVASVAWVRDPLALTLDLSRGWDGAGVTSGLGGRLVVAPAGRIGLEAAAGIERGARVGERAELAVVARF